MGNQSVVIIYCLASLGNKAQCYLLSQIRHRKKPEKPACLWVDVSDCSTQIRSQIRHRTKPETSLKNS